MNSQPKKTKITVLGGGAFGTCIAFVASCKPNNDVILYSIEQDCVDEINNVHTNSKYYKDAIFDKFRATSNLDEALKDTNMILWVLPTQVIPEFFSKYKDKFDPKIPFVSCSKGMIVKEKKFNSEYLQNLYNNQLNYCALSGPSFAVEIVKKYPTLVVVASKNHDTALFVAKTLSCDFFRIYIQNDVLGVEISGALKNIVAIGAGIIEGFGYGYNTKTALIARGTKEIQEFILRYGAKPDALFGLAGIGDLMLTSLGETSRNRTFGYKLGKGMKVEQIYKESKGVVEGVSTLKVVMEYAREHNLELPIMAVIEDIIEGRINIQEGRKRLLTRELKDEFAFAKF